MLSWTRIAAWAGLSLAGCAPEAPVVQLDARLNPHNPFSALATLEVDQDDIAWVEWEDGERQGSTPPTAVSAGEPVEVLVLGLRADRHLMLTAATEGGGASEPVALDTGPLDTTWPTCRARGDTDLGDPDEVFCTNIMTDEGGAYLCVDRSGEPVWAVRHPRGGWIHAFQPLSDGSFAMSTLTESMVAYARASGADAGTLTPLRLEGRTRYEHEWIDDHEVIELQEGPWAGALAVLTASIERWEGREVVGHGIVVFDRHTEEVLWDWSALGDSLEDGEPLDPKLPFDHLGQAGEAVGWLHANALLHAVEDGRQVFWISLRNQDWIAKVDVQTDEVVWRLGYGGDFELVDDLDAAEPTPLDPSGWFFQQHAPEWVERSGARTRLLLFDNGTARPGADEPWSRVVEVEVDESTRQAALSWSWGSPDPQSPDHFYTWGSGDADLSRDGTRVHVARGWSPPLLAELAYPEAEVLWTLECEGQEEAYRVLWAPSLYELDWTLR